MAVSKLWSVTSRLGQVIDYAANPEKTAADIYTEEQYQALRDVLSYAKDEEKTECEFFVEGINCNPATARDQFVSVKKAYGKDDGIQAYHGYLSFKEQDISPELAQKIGMEFANEVWGKRFQVVVTTHLNTKHLHCHYVINSVSFVDGKRLWGDEKAWFKFRLVADRLCEKYGLYYNPNPNRSKQSSYYYKQEQAGMPSRYSITRDAIDEAIAHSTNLKTFDYILTQMGYEHCLSDSRKYWTIVPKGYKKPIRLKSLGENYTEDAIKRRLTENQKVLIVPFAKETVRVRQYRLPTREHKIKKVGGLYGLYLHYCYKLGYLPKYKKQNTIKAAAKATVAAVKAIIAAVKGLIAAIAAGGWVAVVVIIVLCLVALIAGSVFGIFFSGEDSGTGMSMQTVVQEINQEYDDRLEQKKNSVSYDVLEMSGSRAVWKEVLAVYSVKVNTDPDNPMEVATVDETKKQLLSDIFWEMNHISSRTETNTHTKIEESDDGHGNIVQTETTVTETFLYITVSHKTVDEMAAMYGFNQEQKDYLAELLQDENNQLWSQVLYGIGYSDDQIVTVALSQVGNVGGQPYWSWYGFDSRVEWCACFVSWCANECGYIDAGIIPKYAGCVNGVQWFRDRGQWADGSYEPSPGTIIFFDWEGDGVTDHTGIVQRCENGTVYTVEGNSGDTCRTKTYPVGSSVIYGYGIPAY